MRNKNRQRTSEKSNKMDPASISYSHFIKSELFRALQCDWWILTDRGSSKFTSPYSNILLHEEEWRVYYYCNMGWVIPDHFEITPILLKVQSITTRSILTLEKCVYLVIVNMLFCLPSFFLDFQFFTHGLSISPQGLKETPAVIGLCWYIPAPILLGLKYINKYL